MDDEGILDPLVAAIVLFVGPAISLVAARRARASPH